MKRTMLFLLVALVAVSLAFASPAAEVSEVSATRTVTDVWGRTVEVPETVTKIVCLGSGAPRIAGYLDAFDLFCGIEKADSTGITVLRDYSPVYVTDSIMQLPVVGNGGGSGSNNGYPEAIILAEPDVILAGFSAEAADELQKQTGIPVVSVRYTSTGLANDTFYDAVRVFGETIGKKDRAEAVLSYIDSVKKDLNDRTQNVAADAKLKAYSGAVTFSGRHGFCGTYGAFGPFDAVNARNIADEAGKPNYFETDFEMVLSWNPDVIFLDPGNMDIVADEVKARPEYFASLKAVQEGKVYTLPSFNNMGMNITYALIDAYWCGKILYPEAFQDVEISAKAGEIMKALLGADFFSTMEEGGLYYGELNLVQ